jgi:uncharacterized membrane protein YcaP (DUF421 family)
MERLMEILDTLLGLSAKTEQLGILQICLRAVIVFFVLIAYVRLGKKRFLGQASAFDAILLITIGSVASRAITGNAPFFGALAGTLVLILCHWIVSYFAKDSARLSGLIKGHDTIIVKDGSVDRKALSDAHMSLDDLKEDMRQHGVSDPKEVQEARLERSGQLSVIKRA